MGEVSTNGEVAPTQLESGECPNRGGWCPEPPGRTLKAMEPAQPLPTDADEDDDTAVVAAFLAGDSPADAPALQDAPTGMLAGRDNSHKSPTSVSLASRNEPCSEDLLAGLL